LASNPDDPNEPSKFPRLPAVNAPVGAKLIGVGTSRNREAHALAVVNDARRYATFINKRLYPN
jgi:hypothetical protein